MILFLCTIECFCFPGNQTLYLLQTLYIYVYIQSGEFCGFNDDWSCFSEDARLQSYSWGVRLLYDLTLHGLA